MERVPDNYDAFCKHDAEQERELVKRAVCEDCGEPIMEDTCYLISYKLICENCMDEYLIPTPVED